MRIAFYTPGWKAPEQGLLAALQAGCTGDTVDGLRNSEIAPGYDLACVVGVKAKGIVEKLQAAGTPFLYWDKGYHRDWPHWWRVSICAHQPADYIQDMRCAGDRAAAQSWRIGEWRKPTAKGHILLAGSSLKYNNFHNLPHPTQYWTQVLADLRCYTDRPVVYRPKPSWSAAEAIPGASFSWTKDKNFRTIHDDLVGAHALITHGSNACFEALQDGVPAVVLGDAALRCIFSLNLDEIEQPREVPMAERRQIVDNLAYCQWSIPEITSGEAWRFLRKQLADMGKI